MTQLPVIRHRQLVVLAFAALTACTTPDASPTAIAPSVAPLAAKPSSGGASYAVTDLGTAGYLESIAHDVNDAGIVVGQFNSATAISGFARVGGKLVLLPTTSNRAVARAVSNGTTTYVVGFATPTSSSSVPVRWTIDGTTISGPEYLAVARSNIATEVNDRALLAHSVNVGTGTVP